MFESVFGHQKIKHILKNMLAKQTIPNALCFHGVDGIGKKKMARELAKAMFCQTHEACGQCGPCMKFDRNFLPDYKEVVPEGREIKVAPIRKISEELHYKPFETPYKIYLLDNVESMNDGAANAFLKSLEEPPEYVYFFLITADLDKLLPTIQSRCQKMSFQPLNPADREQILVQDFQLEPGLASNLAYISFRQLETDPEAWNSFKENVNHILAFFETMLDRGLALDFFSKFLGSKDETQRFLDHFQACLRELLFQAKNQPVSPGFETWKDRLQSLARKIDAVYLISALESFFYMQANQVRNLNWGYWFNQFSTNALGLNEETERKHRDWLVKKGVFTRG